MSKSQKIRIRLKAYDHKALDQSAAKLQKLRNVPELRFPALFRFLLKKYLYDSAFPHVNKDSREQFEMRTHKRLVDILEPTAKTVDALMRLDLPAGVDIEIKL